MKKVHFFRNWLIPLFPAAYGFGFCVPVDSLFWITFVGKIVVGLILAATLHVVFFEFPDRITKRENAPDVQ